MAKGLDIGTCFLVGASHSDETAMAGVDVRSVRDAFLDVDNEHSIKTMLKMSKVPFIERGDTLFIIGDAALNMANLLKREVRRPLSKGVISPEEKDAEKILYILLEEILGKPKTPGEICVFSIPAAPVDIDGADVAYHEAMFKKIISQMGFQAESMNEAAAIVYSNCAEENFTALATSAGAGMVNTSLLYQTLVGMSFSVGRSGDWIDESTAKAVGTRASNIMLIKEKGVNLMDPSEGDPKYFREREAIVVFYKNLIRYLISNIKTEFRKSQGSIQISEPIPWILSGGTSKAKGFLELFKEELAKVTDFPIPISEIRMANDPLNDVAKGLLIAATLMVD